MLALAQQTTPQDRATRRRATERGGRRSSPAVAEPTVTHPDQPLALESARADTVQRPTTDTQVVAGDGQDPVTWHMDLPESVQTMLIVAHKTVAPRRVAAVRTPGSSPSPARIPVKVVDGRAAVESRLDAHYLDTRDATMEML